MASFRSRRASTQATVYRHGVVRSGTFVTRDEAEAWARQTEAGFGLGPITPARLRCVYALFDAAGAVLYVGKTGDLHKRLIRHRENGLPYASYACLPCTLADADRLERHYIRHLRPRLNKLLNGVIRQDGENVAGVRLQARRPRLRDLRH